MAITLTDDSATISTTEYFLASDSTTATYQTSSCILQVFIDFTNMIAGDSYRIRVYRKINTSSARTIYDATLSGAQSTQHVTPSLVVGGASGAWEVSVQRTAGTDRSIGWSIATVA
jgi:hypothetical protein